MRKVLKRNAIKTSGETQSFSFCEECDSIWYIVGGCSKHNMYVFDLKCFIGSYL